METTEVKPDHLLEGSLEWLHQQTREWISDVEFWREELKFLYHVLRKKELHGNVSSQRLADLEKELVKLSGTDLNELETTLRKHEGKFRNLMDLVSSAVEMDYRHDHKTVLFVMQHFITRMRGFKRLSLSL